MDEEKARQFYVQMEVLQRHLKKLHSHMQEVDEKIDSVRTMQQTVEDAMQIPEGNEILVPLTNGIFIPAKAKAPEKYLINVGSDVAISKTPKEILDILAKQEAELLEYQNAMEQQEKQLRAELTRAEKQVQQELANV